MRTTYSWRREHWQDETILSRFKLTDIHAHCNVVWHSCKKNSKFKIEIWRPFHKCGSYSNTSTLSTTYNLHFLGILCLPDFLDSLTCCSVWLSTTAASSSKSFSFLLTERKSFMLICVELSLTLCKIICVRKTMKCSFNDSKNWNTTFLKHDKPRSFLN